MISDTIIQIKKAESAEIQRKIDEFLAKGGKIEKVDISVCKDNALIFSKRNKTMYGHKDKQVEEIE